MSDDYYWEAKCGNCEDGLYGKSKEIDRSNDEYHIWLKLGSK